MRSRKYNHPDYVLFGITATLIVLGILVLAGISAPISQHKFGNTFHYLFHQVVFGVVIGIISGLIAYKIPLSFIKRRSPVLLLSNLFFLGLVFTPIIGINFRGAARWINLGFASFQPSEFLKLSFILYLASWLASKHKENQKSKIFDKQSFFYNKRYNNSLFLFLIIIAFISLFLILQPDVSTLGIIILSAGVMYFAAETPVSHIILIISIGIAGLTSLIRIAPYRMNRFLVFLNPEAYPMGIGYQVKQSLIAIGAGGIFGMGLAMSRQKSVFLPQSMSDSIFSIFAEETGFIGCLILISLFLLFIWRSFRISKMSSDKFCKFASLGISSWITVQAFINIGAMTGILPLTGIPLPFISYGGSHIVVEITGAGILLNMSKYI